MSGTIKQPEPQDFTSVVALRQLLQLSRDQHWAHDRHPNRPVYRIMGCHAHLLPFWYRLLTLDHAETKALQEEPAVDVYCMEFQNVPYRVQEVGAALLASHPSLRIAKLHMDFNGKDRGVLCCNPTPVEPWRDFLRTRENDQRQHVLFGGQFRCRRI